MKQDISLFATMRDDHREWDYEYLRWRADIEQWQREHDLAVQELMELQTLVHQHGEALQAHAAMLDHRQQDLRDHDRAMSEYQTYGGGERLQEELAESHHQYAERHQGLLAAHTRIRQHHHNVMTQLRRLKEAIEAGM